MGLLSTTTQRQRRKRTPSQQHRITHLINLFLCLVFLSVVLFFDQYGTLTTTIGVVGANETDTTTTTNNYINDSWNDNEEEMISDDSDEMKISHDDSTSEYYENGYEGELTNNIDRDETSDSGTSMSSTTGGGDGSSSVTDSTIKNMDIVDDRSWLDVFADDAKVYLTNDVPKLWNKLHQEYDMRYRRWRDKKQNGSNNDRVFNGNNEELLMKDQSNRRYIDNINHQINYNQIHSFIKRMSIRFARCTAKSWKKLSLVVEPIADNVVARSRNVHEMTSKRTQYIVDSIEHRLQVVADKLGKDICKDLESRCTASDQEDDQITFAWQERILCSSIIETNCSNVQVLER